MRIQSDEDLLDQNVRAQIIEDIEGVENKQRKNEAYKRYLCYKDQTYKYVISQLSKQFDQETVKEMSYAISNLGFTRKTIDKLARVYKYGVEREADKFTEALQIASRECDADNGLKKANRYFKLFKNCLIWLVPKPVSFEEGSKQNIHAIPLPPYLYDAVELASNRERPGAIILSDFEPEASVQYDPNAATANRGHRAQIMYKDGDGKDQLIADQPVDGKDHVDNERKVYVFWSDRYHFKCNKKGEMLTAPEDMLNPIERLPFVNFAEDQDGQFWAIGGNDLVDGAILVNSMISNINHIAVTQGYGQLVMTGKNLPRNLKVGPNKAVLLPQEEGEPTPTLRFETASPPLDQLRSHVEMYVELLLTTNNLSTSGVASNLNGNQSFPSGIAMVIDRAESMEDVEDQRQIFIDNEPRIWHIYAQWHNLLKGRNELVPALQEISLPTEEFDVALKFGAPAAIESEREKLEVLQIKKDLGLISMVDMIKREWPGLTDEEAEEKLKEILAEKMARMGVALTMGKEMPVQEMPEGETSEPVADDVRIEAQAPMPGAPEGTAEVQGEVQAVADTALNGAQVSSMIELVTSISEGRLPRESGIYILQRAFQVSPETAERIVGEAGRSFVPKEDSSVDQDNEPSPSSDKDSGEDRDREPPEEPGDPGKS